MRSQMRGMLLLTMYCRGAPVGWVDRA